MSEMNVSGLSAVDELDWRKSAPSATEKLGYILKHEEFCDVSFHVSENGETAEVIKAHKLWLMTASKVFERMFNGNFRETSQDLNCPIEVDDIDPSSFKTMLTYMYTDELPDNLTTSERVGIVNAARKYDVGDLEELCWSHFMKQLGVENCVTIFQAAQLYNNATVEDVTIKFIKENFDKVLESKDFLHLSFENLRKFMAANSTVVDTELQIFNGMMSWSVAKCKEQNIDLSPANQRLVLGEIINLINFTAIPAADISLTVVPSQILTFEECTLLFQHVNVPLHKLKQLPRHPFSNISRERRTHVVNFSKSNQNPPSAHSDSFNHFKFKVDKPIKILGLGLPGNVAFYEKCIVSLRLVDTYNLVELSVVKKKTVSPSRSVLSVDLDKPADINPHKEYSIKFKIETEGRPMVLSRTSCAVFIENGVTFSTKPNQVMIPQIKFKLI